MFARSRSCERHVESKQRVKAGVAEARDNAIALAHFGFRTRDVLYRDVCTRATLLVFRILGQVPSKKDCLTMRCGRLLLVCGGEGNLAGVERAAAISVSLASRLL